MSEKMTGRKFSSTTIKKMKASSVRANEKRHKLRIQGKYKINNAWEGKKRPNHSKFMVEYNKNNEDKTQYKFKHKSGIVFVGSRRELCRKFPEHNIVNGELGVMVRGGYKTHRGWALF